MTALTTNLDLGELGEQEVEVEYTYHRGYRGDRETPDEPEYCEIDAVKWRGIDIKGELNERVIDCLMGETLDHFNGD